MTTQRLLIKLPPQKPVSLLFRIKTCMKDEEEHVTKAVLGMYAHCHSHSGQLQALYLENNTSDNNDYSAP